MTEKSVEWDWEGVSDNAVREVLRLAEVQLSEITLIAIAADQRATAQAGILAGFGAALLAAGAALITGGGSQDAAAWAALCAGAGMIVASLISGQAAAPSDYLANGDEPRRLRPSMKDEIWMLRHVAEDMQDRITKNRAGLLRSANLTTRAYNVAILAIALSVGLFLGLLAVL